MAFFQVAINIVFARKHLAEKSAKEFLKKGSLKRWSDRRSLSMSSTLRTFRQSTGGNAPIPLFVLFVFFLFCILAGNSIWIFQCGGKMAGDSTASGDNSKHHNLHHSSSFSSSSIPSYHDPQYHPSPSPQKTISSSTLHFFNLTSWLVAHCWIWQLCPPGHVSAAKGYEPWPGQHQRRGMVRGHLAIHLFAKHYLALFGMIVSWNHLLGIAWGATASSECYVRERFFSPILQNIA